MIFKIPVSYEMYGVLEVEAASLDEAMELAQSDDCPLPKDASYVDGSIEIDSQMLEYYNEG